MSQIKAIETTYKGYRFRSRLEARWAVFFDAMRIPWKYEDQGYKREIEYNGETKTYHYLPDFFLPDPWGDGGMFVEVKGDKYALQKNWWDNAQMHDWGGILPNFADSVGKRRGLLLLSDIPEASTHKIYFHPVLQHNQGIFKSYAFFTGAGLSVVENSPLAELLNIAPEYGLDASEDDWVIDTKQVPTDRYYDHVVKAYAAARSARFEHGEKGAL
jgi:hypothetical protein